MIMVGQQLSYRIEIMEELHMSVTRSKNRISSMASKKVWQEAGQRCPFCAESAVEALHVHHIESREYGGSNKFENLILVCANCHGKITHGQISEADVLVKKRELFYSKNAQSKPPLVAKPKKIRNTLNFTGENSGMVANNITFKGGSKPKVGPPLGTVGADPLRKNYMAYMLDKYHECRIADKSFGRFDPYNPGEIRKNIIRQFARAGLYHVPLERFDAVCEYIAGRIDRTPLAKTLHARGQRIYKSFREFAAEQGMASD